MINLTREEREKFSLWLRQDIESDLLMLKQAQKLPHAEPLVKKMKTEISAALIISKKLESIEEMNIG